MIVVALSSGTSADGVDVAAAELWLDGPEETVIRMQPLGHREEPWPDTVREELLATLPPATTSAGDICSLDTRIGRALGDVAASAATDLAGGRADLVVSHGQTVFHWVEDGRCEGTLQLGQPAWIVEATGLPVVSDVRARDVAAGGHGAPLASILDALWLSGPEGPRAALNIGGIANITVVRDSREERAAGDDAERSEPRDEGDRAHPKTLAYDTGPGNALLDTGARRVTGGRQDRDTDGRLAAAGSVRHDLLERLLAEPYYALPPPKSTGRELFRSDYLDAALRDLPEVDDRDLLATLTELTAVTVASACKEQEVTEVIGSGGGMRNPALRAALQDRLGDIPLVSSDERGLPGDAKEAYLFALLGFLTWHQIPGTAPLARRAVRGDRLREPRGNRPGHIAALHRSRRNRAASRNAAVQGFPATPPTIIGAVAAGVTSGLAAGWVRPGDRGVAATLTTGYDSAVLLGVWASFRELRRANAVTAIERRVGRRLSGSGRRPARRRRRATRGRRRRGRVPPGPWSRGRRPGRSSAWPRCNSRLDRRCGCSCATRRETGPRRRPRHSYHRCRRCGCSCARPRGRGP